VLSRETVTNMKRYHVTALIGASLLFTGCGDSDDLKLVPVSGNITINGKPLEGATVAFLPAPDNKAGAPGLDTTGPSGNYKAMTRQRSGLAPGKYRMSVTLPLTKATASKLPDDIQNDPMMAKMALGLDTKDASSKKKAATPVAYEKDVEVANESTVLDYDVKAKEGTSAAK